MATTATDSGSAADPIVRLRTEHDGVAIEKVLVERDGVVGVWFRITANSRRGRHVHLIERLPDGVSHEDVGLHDDYASDDWSRAASSLHLRTVADQSPTVTMYAVRGLDVAPAALARPPEVAEVTSRDRSLSS